MYKINTCPSCNHKATDLKPAFVSLFIKSYVLRETTGLPNYSSFMECPKCDLNFFGQRYHEEEMSKLYSEYRSDNYFSARNCAEPWYTKKINDSIGQDPIEVMARKDVFLNFLNSNIPSSRLKSLAKILDYGGDRGQFIPDSIGESKYVFEVSNAPTVNGVTRLCSQEDLATHSFDLVMLCNVLEHLPNPISFLRNLKDQIKFKPHSYLYLEVPLERFSVKLVGNGKWYEKYLNFLSKNQALAKIIDFYSTAFRLKFGVVPPFGYIKQSEHINFFTEKSLSALVTESLGKSLIKTKINALNSKSGQSLILSCLVEFQEDVEELNHNAES